MELECYKIYNVAPEIRPGVSQRDWMDKFPDRHPYRCLPLTMANSTGWEILCPMDIKIIWDGGEHDYSLKLFTTGDPAAIPSFADSHFRRGIVTFHTGHLFRTPPGWGVWTSGPPNYFKDGIQPLTGLVETDWLPFPFTMNWQMTRPGEVVFKKGEPFCFVMPFEHGKTEQIQPERKLLSSNKQLQDDYLAWNKSRSGFLEKLNARDQDTVKAGWQRHYMRGEKVTGDKADAHQTKRRLKPPKDV
ncbi:MAG TPA: hypothetical protein EYG02_07705 [Henriciella marina]|uniref:DUF6065 family protein n=1 Tax=Henriciella sp. TaxID=1968823 RepID=UPI0017D64441|nr:DUF6065 family protein [Henriciella sp.]HIG22322.1 hypothetical protein [Henriciella sp.]HIK64901.1 hypothetical protein [Henriciella marina]